MSEQAVESNTESTIGGVTGKGFVPGVSGNPGGRPKGLASKVREVLGADDGETLARFWAACLSGYVVTVEPPSDIYPDGQRIYEKVEVRDRVAVSKLLAERGWGKPPQFAPIEDADPLELSEEVAREIAKGFDARLDELAARRAAQAAEQASALPAE